MPKYEVPFNYTVWVEVEAEDEDEALAKAGAPETDSDFLITTKYLQREGDLEISFMGKAHPSLITKLEEE